MRFSIATLARAILGPPPKLVCSSATWREGAAELNRRTGGHRESGAFLLGLRQGETRQIVSFLYYDDVDPTCFRHGIVEFDGRKLGQVWRVCQDRGLMVVADIHVHPAGYGQSGSDKANPMIAEAGHIALILPNYATGAPAPGAIGIFEYRGNRQWLDHSRQGRRIFKLSWW